MRFDIVYLECYDHTKLQEISIKKDRSSYKRGDRNLAEKKGKMSRMMRNKKYGFGGQKKRSKKNNKKSFDMM